jgi:hypothetical protein
MFFAIVFEAEMVILRKKAAPIGAALAFIFQTSI